MGNIIVNKHITTTEEGIKIEDISNKFSEIEGKDYSDGEFVIVHDSVKGNPSKVAVKSKGEISFIGEGIYVPVDDSIEMQKKAENGEIEVKVKICENSPEKEINKLQVRDGGLFVPETNIMDCGSYE